MSLRLAIPSKGRLFEETIDWFAKRDLIIRRKSSDREYAAEVQGFSGLDLVLMSASEIPGALKRGTIDFGVTGQDLVAEKIGDWQAHLHEIALMGFGFADLVFAVPQSWVDVVTLEDLDFVCTDFRANFGARLRIATKYHRIIGRHLHEHDVTNFSLVDSQGATEGVIANEYAEMIADITSSGETLRANHLKILGEPVLRSQATLFSVLPDRLNLEDRNLYENLIKKLG